MYKYGLNRKLICIPHRLEYNIQCTTSDQRQGTCIDIRQCASMSALIRRPNLSMAETTYLRGNQCAWNNFPWVT